MSSCRISRNPMSSSPWSNSKIDPLSITTNLISVPWKPKWESARAVRLRFSSKIHSLSDNRLVVIMQPVQQKFQFLIRAQPKKKTKWTCWEVRVYLERSLLWKTWFLMSLTRSNRSKISSFRNLPRNPKPRASRETLWIRLMPSSASLAPEAIVKIK